jgi:2-amino-4-hydroxy-6-hydroxymethyldihydropteridine diphosphokinase
VTVAFVGLGANLDDPRMHVSQALGELAAIADTRVVKASSLYRSAPVGHAAQPDFINAVAELATGLSAHDLLAELQAIEARHGRRRSFANAARTLDLDLLLYGGETVRDQTLTLPHPRMHERAFVLLPLLEIAPAAVVPGHGPARELLENCAGQAAERID